SVPGTPAAASSTASPRPPELNPDNFRIAFNYGSFGTDVNATYWSGARQGSPGPALRGLGPKSYACWFGTMVRSYVDCTTDARLNITGPMTAIAWIKAEPDGNRFETFLGRNDDSWRADVDWNGFVHWADGKDNRD